MSKLTPALFLLVIFVISIKADFYWKTYKGTIPHDAFPGGHDADGTVTYIGLSYFRSNNWVLPTLIYKGNRIAVGGGNGKEKWETDKHTMILCSNNHTLLKWIPTNSQKISYITDCVTVYAGGGDREDELGRAHQAGRTVTGRIVKGKFYFPDVNFIEVEATEYEILTYNCSNPWIESV